MNKVNVLLLQRMYELDPSRTRRAVNYCYVSVKATYVIYTNWDNVPVTVT